MSLKRKWSIQVMVAPSPNWLRLFVGATRNYHTFLAVVNDNQEIMAELHFSGKNKKGVTFRRDNHLGRSDFRISSFFNMISEASGSEKNGNLYRRVLDVVFPNNDAPRLKACLLVSTPDKRLRSISDMEGTEVRRHVSVKGCEDEIIQLWQTCCAVAERINRQNFIFTSYGMGLSANNCRAGTKAVVAQALGKEFPYIGPNGRFDTNDRSFFHWGKNLGYGRNLPVANHIELTPPIMNTDTLTTLLYWRDHLRKTCKDVSVLQKTKKLEIA
jgi:hypothetical protein